MNEHGPERQYSPEVTDNDLLAQAFVTDTFKSARIMQSREFYSEAEAEVARRDFLERVQKNFASLADIGDVVFRISGSGVKIPLVEQRPADIEGASVGYEILLHEKGVESLDPISSLEVNLIDVVSSILKPTHDTFILNAHFVMQSESPQEATINIEGFPTPVASIYVFRRYLVECTNNSVIEIPELEQRRLHKELVSDLANQGLARNVFGRKLNRLRSAFYNANDRQFTNLADLKLLKSIGEFSDSYARKGLQQSDLMSRSLIDTIGKGRLLQVDTITVSGNTSIGTTVTGKVVEVLMPDSAGDSFVPTIVLEVDSAADGAELVQVPISNVYSLRF